MSDIPSVLYANDINEELWGLRCVCGCNYEEHCHTPGHEHCEGVQPKNAWLAAKCSCKGFQLYKGEHKADGRYSCGYEFCACGRSMLKGTPCPSIKQLQEANL